MLRDFKAATVAAGLGHRLEKRSGRKPLTFHDLRHVFGSMAVQTEPLTDVQHWMGHADITTTMRYVHYVPRPEAQRRLSAAWSEHGEDTAPAGAEARPHSGRAEMG